MRKYLPTGLFNLFTFQYQMFMISHYETYDQMTAVMLRRHHICHHLYVYLILYSPTPFCTITRMNDVILTTKYNRSTRGRCCGFLPPDVDKSYHRVASQIAPPTSLCSSYVDRSGRCMYLWS